ncbi:MAG: hypothetical protein M1822_002214 [Bathelium mastoideum]|nr:MAG: hypothetical protein M1822_002214 [Bathelium mastoideum]
MPHSSLKPLEEARWDNDRRPALYTTLSVLLILNNLVTVARLLGNYLLHYRHASFRLSRIFIEDYFIFLSAICVDLVIGNLLQSTRDGLGLHSWRINAADPHYPRNLSNSFKHVWIVMVLTGPTFTFIKLTLLFFYKRLFLINQRWLKVAWWANLIYVILWLFGATGFYIFQCWPVSWYYMRYYSKYDVEPPYPIEGQCNATNTTHVSIPIIFGLASDVAILLLPVVTISRLHISRRTKLGLTGIFSVDTDDKNDPSYGVVTFLILSASTEVTGVICACLPVILPTLMKAYKHGRNSLLHRDHGIYDGTINAGSAQTHRNHGFTALDDPRLTSTIYCGSQKGGHDIEGQIVGKDSFALTGGAQVSPATGLRQGDPRGSHKDSNDKSRPPQIWVERQIEVNSVPQNPHRNE